tara:strand:+ start:148 stop:594 length:447 start_codon:yes stop_codon:yes gene_type:complete
MRKIKAIFFILIFFTSNSIIANNLNDAEKWIYSNVIDDMIICNTYFLIASEGLERSGHDEAEVLKKIYDELFFITYQFSKKINLQDEALMSKFESSRDQQLKLMDYDYVNLSLLTDKYGTSCKESFEDQFNARLHFWHLEAKKRFDWY